MHGTVNIEVHKERHKKLHSSLDELIADFIMQTKKLPSKTTILELMQWSWEQAQNPTEPGDNNG